MLYRVFIALTCASLIIVSAQAKPVRLTANQVSIVDCLLPGKTRKLGVYRTYISPKRPVKTSANECEIRGGDYVLYDRASLSTALNVWQESASKGDAQSQYFVGEIFEKGMGQEPDYIMAAAWYGRASKQGYNPASMSLGRLYEEGKGVERDLVKAMNLYRQASNLNKEEIAYASVFEELQALDAAKFEQLRSVDEAKIGDLEQRLGAEKQKTAQLYQTAEKLKAQLLSSRNNIGNLQTDITQLEAKLKETDQKSQNVDYSNTQQLLSDLQQSQQRLTDQMSVAQVLQHEIDLLKKGSQSKQLLKQELRKAKLNLAALTTANQSKQADLTKSLSRIEELERQLELRPVADSLIAVRKELKSETNALTNLLKASQARVQQQEAQLSVLRDEIEAANSQQSQKNADNQLLANQYQQASNKLASLNIANQVKQADLENALSKIEDLEKQLELSPDQDSLIAIRKESELESNELVEQLKVAKAEIKQQESQLFDLRNQIDKNNAQQSQYGAENELLAFGYQQASSELAALKTQSSALETKLQVSELKVKSLQSAKAGNESEKIATIRETLNSLKNSYDYGLVVARSEQKSKKQKIANLTKQLNVKAHKIASKQQVIDSLQNRLLVVEKQAKQSALQLQTARTEVNKAKERISSLLVKVDSLPNSRLLQDQLDQKQRALEAESTKRLALASALQKNEQKIQNLGQALNELQPQDGPVIAVKWPKFENVNGQTHGKAAAGSIVNVVGAVYPVKKIVEFTINGKKAELDTNGLFLSPVELSNKIVTLKLQAKDNRGRVTSSELLITPTYSSTLEEIKPVVKKSRGVKLGNYHALVFGNNTYDPKKGWDPLDTAINDAQAMAAVLEEQYGFEVHLELDADRDTMLTSLEKMRKRLTADDNLLVYYAGHGLIDAENGQGYWVPVDGTTDSSVKWVSNASITDQIRAMTARNVMVIADSCYSASMMRSGVVTLRSGLTSEKKMTRLKEDIKLITRVALSSGGLQPVSDSINNSQNSVFTSALLKVLKNNKKLLDADSLATEVGLMVSVATQDTVRQVPRYAPLARGGHQGGEFYFSPKNKK